MRARDIQKALKRAAKITVLNLRCVKPSLKEIPEAIYAFKNLEELDLRGNEITRLPLTLFDAFPKLKRLNLSHNKPLQIEDIPHFRFHGLQSIDLSDCGLISLPDFIFKLNRLEHLELGGNKFKSDLKKLFHIAPLKHLGLAKTGIRDAGFPFDQLLNLTSIDLSYNQITRLPDAFYVNQNLEKLIISGNPDLYELKKLAHLTNLKVLDISNTAISTLPETTNFKQLEMIDISTTRVKELPDEMVTWPNLSNTICRYSPAMRKKIQRIDRYRKDFNWLALNTGQRLRFFRFFHNKTAHASSLPTIELLAAANSGITEVRYTALEIIEKRSSGKIATLAVDEMEEVVFTGRVIFSEQFKTRLAGMGITIKKSPGEATTHVIIGEYPFYQGLTSSSSFPEVLTVRNLFHWLQKGKPIKIYPNQAKYHEKILDLLNTNNKSNIDLALQILRTGGVPPKLITKLFILWKRTRLPQRKVMLKDLLELYGASGLPKFMALDKDDPMNPPPKINKSKYRRVGLDPEAIKRHLGI